MKIRTPYVFVPTALAVALVASAADTTPAPAEAPPPDKTETIVVQGTRAHFEVPKTPAARPDMPDLKLKLPAYTLESRDYIWPSGLRMVFQADHSQPVVAITTVYDRGSTSDPIGKEGIAHFVEHMWFRGQHLDASDPSGTKRLPKVWDILSDLGCDLNASTADDWTNYMSVCPATSMPALLRLESLRLENAIEGVEASVVDTERDVIRNELRMRYENSDFGNVLPYLFQKLYPEGHPYSRLGIGTHESLFNCKLEDIQKFVDDNYIAPNTTITVVGDFDLGEVPKLIADNFDPKFLVDAKNPTATLKLQESMPPRIDRNAAPPTPPEPRDQTIGVYEANVEQPLVVIGWTVPGAYRGHDANYGIAANIAGSLMEQYFDVNDARVDVDEGGVGCFLWDSKVDSKVICIVSIKKSVDLEKFDATSVAERAADQIALMWNPDYFATGEFNQALERSRMDGLVDVLRSLDLFATVGGGRATDIAHHVHFTGSIQAHTDQMNDIMAINAAEIQDTAYKYLRRDRMVQVFLKPIPEDDLALDAAQGSDYVAAEDGVLRSTIDPKEITAEVIKDFTIMPQTDLIQEKVLPNGLRIVVIEHGEAPMVQAGLIVNSGTLTASPLVLDRFAEYIVDTLWDRYDPNNRRIDPLRIAGNWTSTTASDYTYRAVNAASGNLDGALWFLREGVEQLRIDADGRVEYVKDRKADLKWNWKQRDFWVDDAIEAHTLGDSARGRMEWDEFQWEEWEKAPDVASGTALAYARAKYQPKNATLLVVGNVDADDTLALAEYYFQGWQPHPSIDASAPAPKLPPPVAPTVAPEVVIFNHDGRTQTDVTFACPIDAGRHDQDGLRTLLGDYLDEQAWIILRENGGKTYGAGAGASSTPEGASSLFMNTLVQNDGVTLAIKTFEELAKRAEAGTFDVDRLQIHKLNRGKKQVNRQQSIVQMNGRLLGTLGLQEPWTYLDNYPDRLAAVTPADLQKAMGQCSQHYIVTLNGPKEVLEPALTAAGITYTVFDYKQARKDMLAKYDPKMLKKVLKAEAKAEAKEAKEAAKAGTTPAPATP